MEQQPFNRELAEAGHPIAFAEPKRWEGCSDLKFEKYVERANAPYRVVVSVKAQDGEIFTTSCPESALVMVQKKKKKILVRVYRDRNLYAECKPCNGRDWANDIKWISDPVEVEVDDE